MTASVIIPLDCLSKNGNVRSRAHASENLVETLERIAGKGDWMLWWTEDEVHTALTHDRNNWAWCPYGPIDPCVSSSHSNRQTQMRIFFKNPDHAILFKLSWA